MGPFAVSLNVTMRIVVGVSSKERSCDVEYSCNPHLIGAVDPQGQSKGNPVSFFHPPTAG